MLWVHECTQMKHEISNSYERAANASNRGCVRVYSFQLYVFASALGPYIVHSSHTFDESNFAFFNARNVCLYVRACSCVLICGLFLLHTTNEMCFCANVCDVNCFDDFGLDGMCNCISLQLNKWIYGCFDGTKTYTVISAPSIRFRFD